MTPATAYRHNFTLDTMTAEAGIAFTEAMNCIFNHIAETTAANGNSPQINAIDILDRILLTNNEIMDLMKRKARLLTNHQNILSSKVN